MRFISQDQFETNMLRGVRGKYFRSALKRVLREHKGRLAFLLLDHYTVSIRIDDHPHITAHYSNGLVELTGAPDDAFWCINHDRLTFADLMAYATP